MKLFQENKFHFRSVLFSIGPRKIPLMLDVFNMSRSLANPSCSWASFAEFFRSSASRVRTMFSAPYARAYLRHSSHMRSRSAATSWFYPASLDWSAVLSMSWEVCALSSSLLRSLRCRSYASPLLRAELRDVRILSSESCRESTSSISSQILSSRFVNAL